MFDDKQPGWVEVRMDDGRRFHAKYRIHRNVEDHKDRPSYMQHDLQWSTPL